MKSFPLFIARTATAVIFFAALAFPSRPASAVDIVVPGFASTEGDSGNRFPFSLGNDIPVVNSLRYQQVYGAKTFFAISGPTALTQIAFRVDAGESAFASTLSGIRIDLSTTNRLVDGLSNTFADNLGANNVTVFNGSLSLSSAGAVNSLGLFDVVINLSTPFLYDPSVGNLLLDVRNFNGGTTRFLDSSTRTDDATSRVYALDVNSPTANTEFPSDGLITQFRFAAVTVPEPGAFPLAATGLLALGLLTARRVRGTAR